MADEKNVNTAESFGNEVATIQEQHEGVVAIFDNNPARFFSSISGGTLKEKAQTLQALGDPTYKLQDVANNFILNVTDVVAHAVKISDMNNPGVMKDMTRVVLMLANGETVAGVSGGFKQSLENVMALFGKPSWKTAEMPKGLPMLIRRVACKQGNTYNINVVFDSKLQVKG